MANNNNLECPYCGLIFPNPVQFSNVREVILDNNTYQCPRCKNSFTPPRVTGSVDAEGNISSLRSYLSSNLSKENLLSLQTLVQQGQVDAQVRENFTQEADKIAPGLGQKLNAYFGGHTNNMALLQTIAALLSVLIAGIGLYASLSSAPSTVINNTTNNYYGPRGETKTEQIKKPKPGKLGSNLTPPKKVRKKRGKRT